MGSALTHIDKHSHFNDLDVSSEYIRRTLSPKYFTHTERFYHVPALNAEIAIANNLEWEVIGDNMTAVLTTYATGGGITLTTAGADADQGILRSHLDTKQSALAQIDWSTSREPYMRVDLVTGASVADIALWARFASTDSLSEATAALLISDPADQFGFLFGEATGDFNTTWSAVTSRGGTDTQTNSLKLADNTASGVTVAASTLYRMEFWLDSDRKPHYYINDIKVATADNTALGAVTTLDPYIGVMAEGAAAAKAVTIRSLTVSQLYG